MIAAAQIEMPTDTLLTASPVAKTIRRSPGSLPLQPSVLFPGTAPGSATSFRSNWQSTLHAIGMTPEDSDARQSGIARTTKSEGEAQQVDESDDLPQSTKGINSVFFAASAMQQKSASTAPDAATFSSHPRSTNRSNVSTVRVSQTITGDAPGSADRRALPTARIASAEKPRKGASETYISHALVHPQISMQFGPGLAQQAPELARNFSATSQVMQQDPLRPAASDSDSSHVAPGLELSALHTRAVEQSFPVKESEISLRDLQPSPRVPSIVPDSAPPALKQSPVLGPDAAKQTSVVSTSSPALSATNETLGPPSPQTDRPAIVPSTSAHANREPQIAVAPKPVHASSPLAMNLETKSVPEKSAQRSARPLLQSAPQSATTSISHADPAHIDPSVTPASTLLTPHESGGLAVHNPSVTPATIDAAVPIPSHAHVAANSPAASGRDAFDMLDADASTIAPTWVLAGAHQAEAGFHDPALGWVSVHAQSDSTGVHAAVIPSSSDAAQSLSGHLAGLNAYLAEHHSSVEGVTLANPENLSLRDAMQQGSSQHPNQGSDSREQTGSSRDAQSEELSLAHTLPSLIGTAGALPTGHSLESRYISVIA